MNFSDEFPPSVCIGRSQARGTVQELGLVLTAVAIEHRIEFDGHDWCLRVRESDEAAARLELASYWRENQPSQDRALPLRAPNVDSGWVGVFGYLLVIWALPSLESASTFGWDWRAMGSMHAEAVRGGEWWRIITAMTLHGDFAHLIGNSLFGAVFGLFVGRHLGSGAGWLLVVVSGALANLFNAAIQPDAFRSVGASTATFAALALVGSFVWRRGYLRGWDWRRRFAPVFGGIALLAFTGFGGENTDVVGHVMGFAFGFLLGFVAGGLDLRRLGHSGQLLCGLAAVGLIVWAWRLAGAAVVAPL
jgi:rhomboid protease GluP